MSSETITAILLGIVEGITEYLPVSSTGHLILATELLGYDAQKWALFNIAIQPGAILAILVLYWRTFRDVIVGLTGLEPDSIAFTRNLLIAFTPAVVLGLILGDQIELLLENAGIVAASLVIGGIAILIVERLAKPVDLGGVSKVSLRQSTLIGLVQCLAMIPGVSRSGATILGAMALGVDRKTAAEFSFFLAVPTLTGATAMQLYKHGAGMTAEDMRLIAIGFVVAFIVALAVVKVFVTVVSRIGFAPFAWYRIIAGLAAGAWLLAR
jgi:undecaprenyl-diphosphatase